MKTILRLALFVLCTAPAALAAESPRLIPFQGRLTDQQGVAYSNGQFTVLFQLYDGPVGGTPSWSERHEKVGVMNGMVNIFLGSISSLANQSFSETRHLGITIDADNNPNTPDPEMVPRQMIIPAFWAKQADNSLNSAKLNSYDWTSVFGVNNPTGPIPASKLADGSIPGTKLAPISISGAQIAPGSIAAINIAAGGIVTSNIADGAVSIQKLESRPVTNNAPLGGVALSRLSTNENYFSLSNTDSGAGNGIDLTNTFVTIQTTGRRPVWVGLVSAGTNLNNISYVQLGFAVNPIANLMFVEDASRIIANERILTYATAPGVGELLLPVSSFHTLTLPSPGTHTYNLRVAALNGTVIMNRFRLVAFEL